MSMLAQITIVIIVATYMAVTGILVYRYGLMEAVCLLGLFLFLMMVDNFLKRVLSRGVKE